MKENSQLLTGWSAAYPFAQLFTVFQIALKPKNLTHTEATAIPYVAMTSWKALVDNAGLNANTTPGKRSVSRTSRTNHDSLNLMASLT